MNLGIQDLGRTLRRTEVLVCNLALLVSHQIRFKTAIIIRLPDNFSSVINTDDTSAPSPLLTSNFVVCCSSARNASLNVHYG